MNLTPMQEKPKIKEQAEERVDNYATGSKGIAESIVEKSSGVRLIKVEKTQAKDGIKVTLHRIELAAEWIAVFLTVEVLLSVLSLENTDPDCTIVFSDKASIATEGDYESKVTSKGPNYKSIKHRLKIGAKRYGAVKFEDLPYNEPAITFEFQFMESKLASVPGAGIWSFVFEVQIQK